MNDYVEYFAHYSKGEDEAMNALIIKMSYELDVTVPLLQILDTKFLLEVHNSRLSFLRYKSQATKGIFLAISSILRLHRFQAFGDLRYALDAITISCFALNNPEQFREILEKYGEKGTKPGNYLKKHTKLSEMIFDAAKKYLQLHDKPFNKLIFDLKSFTSTYGSHVFYANTEFNTDFKNHNKAFHNIFDEPTEDYINLSRQSLLLIGNIIIQYILFMFRNAGKEKIIVHDVISDVQELKNKILAGIDVLKTVKANA